MTTRRGFLKIGGLSTLLGAHSARAISSNHSAVSKDDSERWMDPSLAGRAPVRTLNGWTLPYRMKNGVKEFHLVAEPIEHEFAPGSKATCWGYNGSTPGPTIEGRG